MIVIDAEGLKQQGSDSTPDESGGKNYVIGPHLEMFEGGNVAQMQPVAEAVANGDEEPPEADVYITIDEEANVEGSVWEILQSFSHHKMWLVKLCRGNKSGEHQCLCCRRR